jgi:hypothetical protein
VQRRKTWRKPGIEKGLFQPLFHLILIEGGFIMKRILLATLLISGLLQGCAVQVASSAVGLAAGTAIGVAKVPFQIGGAVVDVASGG